MTDIFLKFVNMSIAASWLVLAVLIFRLIFKRAPKWLNPILWSIVGLRLIMPFSIESALSLIPSPEAISPEIMYTQQPEIHSGIPVVNHLVNPIISETLAPAPGASVNPLQILMMIAAGIWVIGIVLLLLYTAVSYLRLHSQMKTAVLLKDNIYQSENVLSPFVMGILRPRIYLPFQMAEQDRAYVIAHEQTHIRRCDHWTKPLGFLLLSFYWFHPLLWIAYILLCRDIELACDERVIKELGLEQRADYSQALLNCSVSYKMISACPLAFGEVGVKERVKNVLNYRKPAFWMVVAAFCFCVVAAVCFLTDPTTLKLDDIIFEKGYTITKQEKYDFTLSIPKEKLTDSIYTPEGQIFKKNEVVVYQTDTTNVYLKYVMPSDTDENMLFFVFDFSYKLPKAGKIVIPHYKDVNDHSTDIIPNPNYRANTYISLKNGTLYTPTQRYVNAVKEHLWGPEEQFGFRVSTEAYRSAEGIMMIDVSCYEWTYDSGKEAGIVIIDDDAEPQQENDVMENPTEEEVLAMREMVTEGMSEDEITRLTENVKSANQAMEAAYLHDNLFGKLEDRDSLHWNYFDETGEIQIGWSDDGAPVMAYNRFDAYNFIELFEDMRKSVHNEKLSADLQYMIDETRLAAETHKMEHANNVYKMLHDMDYFLLRYGPVDIGTYTQDDSTVTKYYGVLSVYGTSDIGWR